MSRQPATPVVRPLPVVDSAVALREFILSRPEDLDGNRIAWCVLPSYLIETSDGNITPLVEFVFKGKMINMYVEFCDVQKNNGHLVNATEVTTPVLCSDLPCATSQSIISEVVSYVSEIANLMATDDFKTDELSWDIRSWENDQRVDVLVNF